MRDTCETLKIKSDNPDHEEGFVIINASDFDPEKHERYDASAGASPFAEMKYAELKATAEASGITIPANASKAVLIALLEEAAAP